VTDTRISGVIKLWPELCGTVLKIIPELNLEELIEEGEGEVREDCEEKLKELK
jgi:hypothetical protein